MTETLVRKRRFRGIGLVALLAGALAVVSAGPAAAAEKSLTYKGGFPLIGTREQGVSEGLVVVLHRVDGDEHAA